MPYELRFQDPSSAATRYLDEEVVAQLLDPAIVIIEGIFAFATASGAAAVVGDPAFEAFARRDGELRLIVGLDAITDRRALEYLAEAALRHTGHLKVKVFKNRSAPLFHPKILRAWSADGSGTIIVGSGNLTSGGIRANLEAYSVLRFTRHDPPDLGEWDRFLGDHAAEITDIDEEALERGDRNGERVAAARAAGRGAGRPRGPLRRDEAAEAAVAAEEAVVQQEIVGAATPTDRMLIAEVPRAGSRWQQVHFNEDIAREYFHAAPHSPDRVVLYRFQAGVGLIEEPPRPVVFGPNRNHRIEFGAHRGDPYPDPGRPILVLHELGLRTHSYAMLFPGDPGHPEMERLLADNPSVGSGVRRVITTRALVSGYWPAAPI